MVEARSVRKAFGAVDVLRGVDLSVERGEVVCVIGPSGSGKTTLLRCLNRLETIDSGRVMVGGRLIGYREEVTAGSSRARTTSCAASASPSAWSSSASTCSRTAPPSRT